MEVTFLAGAEADLFAAWARYEELLPGLGDRFEAEVRTALARIVELPESAPVYAGEFRRLLVRRFEHGIFYRVHGARIVVTAVLNLRQDPAKIRERLDL
ncbi:MAG: type II toxin-antitoxin system RelE/ParE family toxin [Verrucomicrobia bacterium]|nr:type II toxin-antitoxin system RelE/ParE family toxin [Verrucomicrobiota bacterium]